MSRETRLEFEGAIHWVRIAGRPGATISFDEMTSADRVTALAARTKQATARLKLIFGVSRKYEAAVHAYVLLANEIQLVLTTLGAPLEWIMRDLKSALSRLARASGHAQVGRRIFRGRYQSRLIAPEYLAHAVRRVHMAPVRLGLSDSCASYPFSSDHLYRLERAETELSTSEVRAWMADRGYKGLSGYSEFMGGTDTGYVDRLFRGEGSSDRRIVGGKLFSQEARARARATVIRIPVERVIELVAAMVGIDPLEIATATHAGSRARALVAWHVSRLGIASCADIARKYSVSEGALRRATRRYRQSRPDLFNRGLILYSGRSPRLETLG